MMMGDYDLITTSNALVFPNEDISSQDWARIGNEIYKRGEALSWWLADWAAYGELKYGELKQFCEVNGINYGTIKTLSWVAQSVEKSRRRDLLSFQHHREVAPLEPAKQKKFLDLAEKEKLSVSDMRARIREDGAEHGPEKTFGPPPAIFAVEKFWLDAEVFFDRNAATLEESKDELWDKAKPALEKMAKLWPDKITFNE